METLRHVLRYAWRSLLRQPSFALPASLTLAHGIGATTAIFSVVHAILLRPLPYADSDRIVALMNLWTQTGRRGSTVSAPDYHDWKAQNQSFDAFAYFSGGETSAKELPRLVQKAFLSLVQQSHDLALRDVDPDRA